MSLIIRLQETFSDTSLPKLYRDSIINAGTEGCWDFANPYCWNPSASVVDGATIANLVDGKPAAALKVTTGGAVTFNGSGFVLVTGGQGTDHSQINLDAAGTNVIQNAAHNYLICGWFHFPASDPGGIIGGMLFSKEPAYSGAGLNVRGSYTGGGEIDAKFGGTSGSVDMMKSFAAAGKHQIGIAREGTTERLFLDGALVAAATDSSGSSFVNTSPFSMGGNDRLSGATGIPGLVLYRAFVEDLTVSGLSATAQVAADYATNVSRFA